MDWEEVNFDTLPQDPDFKGPVLRKSSANGDSDPDWEARLIIVTIAALTLLILVKRAVLPPQRQSLSRVLQGPWLPRTVAAWSIRKTRVLKSNKSRSLVLAPPYLTEP